MRQWRALGTLPASDRRASSFVLRPPRFASAGQPKGLSLRGSIKTSNCGAAASLFGALFVWLSCAGWLTCLTNGEALLGQQLHSSVDRDMNCAGVLVKPTIGAQGIFFALADIIQFRALVD